MFKLSYIVKKSSSPILGERRVTDSAVCSGIFREIYDICGADLEDIERCYALFMNHAGRVIGFCEISSGGTTKTVMDSRVVLRFALLCNATQLAICHNHPSGEPHPGEADIKQTESLHNACEAVGVNLLDHIILTEKSYYSFSDEMIIV